MIITYSSLNEIPEVAAKVIAAIADKKVVAFYGDMGAGKTTLIKAICSQLGVDEKEISSPTFSLVNEYKTTSGSIYHFDFYRILKLEEAFDIGFEEYIYGTTLCLIEWPDLVETLLPEDTLRINIFVDGERRRIEIVGV